MFLPKTDYLPHLILQQEEYRLGISEEFESLLCIYYSEFE